MRSIFLFGVMVVNMWSTTCTLLTLVTTVRLWCLLLSHVWSFVLQMVCPYCYQIYKQRDNFVFHLQAMHNVGAKPSCPTCGKDDFKSLSAMKVHKPKCRQLQAAKWQCALMYSRSNWIPSLETFARYRSRCWCLKKSMSSKGGYLTMNAITLKVHNQLVLLVCWGLLTA